MQYMNFDSEVSRLGATLPELDSYKRKGFLLSLQPPKPSLDFTYQGLFSR